MQVVGLTGRALRRTVQYFDFRPTFDNGRKRPCQRSVLKPLCTPGMGVILWGVSPLYVNPVYGNNIDISISQKQGHHREVLSEGSWSAKR